MAFNNYDKKNFCFDTNFIVKKQNSKRQKLKNSDIIYFNEFFKLIRKKEYVPSEVDKFFKKLLRVDIKKKCHNCGKKMNRLAAQLFK